MNQNIASHCVIGGVYDVNDWCDKCKPLIHDTMISLLRHYQGSGSQSTRRIIDAFSSNIQSITTKNQVPCTIYRFLDLPELSEYKQGSSSSIVNQYISCWSSNFNYCKTNIRYGIIMSIDIDENDTRCLVDYRGNAEIEVLPGEYMLLLKPGEYTVNIVHVNTT